MLTESQVVEALLRQHQEFVKEQFEALRDEANGRFDRVETRMGRIEDTVGAIVVQTTKTNGTVGRHESEIRALQSPDQKTAPFLTQSEGRLLGKAVGYSVTAGTILWGLVKIVAAKWEPIVEILR